VIGCAECRALAVPHEDDRQSRRAARRPM